jgi:bifunctional non-homologous end joining protein LigD
MSLSQYRKKRNFRDTPEPLEGKSSGSKPIFVMQRHKASRLHYDFRLEMDGVLKSWAVPKGPSLNPVDKRLAMMVEDHPLDYAAFHGVIPEGNYGAGIVEIWDHGTYDLSDKTPDGLKAIKKGSIKFTLHGRKLKGEFALARMNTGEKNAWLLIKHRDNHATELPFTSESLTAKKSPINIALVRDAEKKGKRSKKV